MCVFPYLSIRGVVTDRRLQPPRELSATTARSILGPRSSGEGSFYTRTYPGLGWMSYVRMRRTAVPEITTRALDACDVPHEKLQVRATRFAPLTSSFFRLRDVTFQGEKDHGRKRKTEERERKGDALPVHTSALPAVVMKLRRRSPRARLKRLKYHAVTQCVA